MTDDVAKYNIERWAALVKAEALFTRPWLQLNPTSARQKVDPDRRLGDIAGKDLLCLAGGGGQQSAAFALLGARVTVFDLSEAQLAKDRAAAAHYNVEIKTYQGDMRDLSSLGESAFDLVWQAYSLNFVPDARQVFGQVGRVLRPNGLYYFMCANPFAAGLGTRDWTGNGYLLKLPYIDGAEINYADEDWVFKTGTETDPINGPKEYRQTLSSLINGLIDHGFIILHLEEHLRPAPEAKPGSWDHLKTIAPPWLKFWVSYHPDFLEAGASTTQ